MKHGTSGGKRQREAERDRKKVEKQERLRRNRERPTSGADIVEAAAPLPEVKLEDVVLGVPSRPRRGVGPTRVFVGGLSWDTTAEGLRTAFSKFGTILETTVISDRDTGRSRGFGFVSFEDARAADEAIAQMSGRELDGRTLKVNRADPR
jgi:RNA recognition motif-containing protein